MPASRQSSGGPHPTTVGLSLLLLVPGLGLADLLVSTNDGTMPGMAAALRHGVLVQGVMPGAGSFYSVAETGHDLLAGWRQGVGEAPAGVEAVCERWDLGTGGPTCTRLPSRGVQPVSSLRSLAEAAVKLAAGQASGGGVLLPYDGLLTLQVDSMLVDARQPGYSGEAALVSARAWRQALMGLDAAFGYCLRQLDLSAWTIALASTCSAEAVYASLDPEQIRGLLHVLPGGAAAEIRPGAKWPRDGAWAQVRERSGPAKSGRRLVAPSGYALVGGDAPLPRAIPSAGGFMLVLGPGLPEGQRLAAFSPAAAGELLSGLAKGPERPQARGLGTP